MSHRSTVKHNLHRLCKSACRHQHHLFVNCQFLNSCCILDVTCNFFKMSNMVAASACSRDFRVQASTVSESWLFPEIIQCSAYITGMNLLLKNHSLTELDLVQLLFLLMFTPFVFFQGEVQFWHNWWDRSPWRDTKASSGIYRWKIGESDIKWNAYLTMHTGIISHAFCISTTHYILFSGLSNKGNGIRGNHNPKEGEEYAELQFAQQL